MKTKDVSLVFNVPGGMKKMFNDSQGQRKYAVLGGRQDIMKILVTEFGSRCDWALMTDTFFKSGYGIALPEGSPYKEVFDTR